MLFKTNKQKTGGSFSYISRAVVVFVFVLFLSADFLLHISCWLHFCLGSFSYTPCDGFIYLWGVSLTYPVQASFLSGELLLHAGFFSFSSVEFLLHIPCWLLFFSFFFFCVGIASQVCSLL